MPQIKNKKLLPYNINQVYEVIKDVTKYPDFIPWFEKVEIISTDDSVLISDVTVRFMSIKAQYISKTIFEPPLEKDSQQIARAEVSMIQGPFTHFMTIWSLKQKTPQNTLVELECDFAFNNLLYNKIASMALKPMNEKIISAFTQRVEQLAECGMIKSNSIQKNLFK